MLVIKLKQSTGMCVNLCNHVEEHHTDHLTDTHSEKAFQIDYTELYNTKNNNIRILYLLVMWTQQNHTEKHFVPNTSYPHKN